MVISLTRSSSQLNYPQCFYFRKYFAQKIFYLNVPPPILNVHFVKLQACTTRQSADARKSRWLSPSHAPLLPTAFSTSWCIAAPRIPPFNRRRCSIMAHQIGCVMLKSAMNRSSCGPSAPPPWLHLDKPPRLHRTMGSHHIVLMLWGYIEIHIRTPIDRCWGSNIKGFM